MSEKRRGLGRGLGALIPTGLDGQRPSGERPVDVFFPDAKREAADAAAAAAAATLVTERAPVEGTAGTNGTPTTNGATSDGVVTDGPVGRDAAGVDVVDGSGDPGAVVGGGDATSPTTGTPSGPAALPAAEIDGLVEVPGARFAELPVTSIRPNPRQPRTVFDEDALEELVGSIREIGVLQPVVVRAVGDGYELIMGERRWRATQAAGLDTIPAIVRETEDSDLLRDALLENLHRAQLNPLEEAAAYQQLLDDFGCTHEELATRIHRSRPQISNTLRLLKLPPLVQRRVAAGVLSAGHARALLGLSDGAAIERLAQRIVAEGLSVRAVEEIVSMGVDGATPARRAAPRAGDRNAALDDLAARLSDRFDTRVKVSLGKTRGRLTVEFASVQDLNRILESFAPEDPGLLKG
ncbi:ParB/RepB/Spo0J family partition protein [Cellulomonas fimi]|uniref:ParB-like partition protein n=1 Tax=Cellulomonas fimi (strain ATCC 484 / DSM 20113 / JCM 1341 / CCUG 24087 / LMG 16345 / NBRC 15513 / NCIMB 8980 / NCTC 7547 / NRS-133) TaxID=590998 RepID=F4H657_CELFA|nr:ParB/RepB/Spo0J family partition protein [Cellulomonas fimi]AEE47907.1 parB-like partition protein [Cellulomonas fimi ATCC 484]NNH07590.1 ParB/RepB/Spo0J family partition protein [Cellulomonas fimi]VEH37116.1 Probable chromosome-partitioning protein parB [Cellulomonas fimi]